MKQSKLRPISTKRAAQLVEYRKLIARLHAFNLESHMGYPVSEWTGKKPHLIVWHEEMFMWLVPHHIDGRRGERLLDPFNIILITEQEHMGDNGIQKHNTWEAKQKLADIVRPLRIQQGFQPND